MIIQCSRSYYTAKINVQKFKLSLKKQCHVQQEIVENKLEHMTDKPHFRVLQVSLLKF